jgi:hypothetical protein
VSPVCCKCGETFDSDRKYHRYCWSCYWEERDNGRWTDDARSSDRRKPPPQTRRPPLTLDTRFLRDAITLTHPDRHPVERSRTANAVTAALLELLRQQRGAS